VLRSTTCPSWSPILYHVERRDRREAGRHVGYNFLRNYKVVIDYPAKRSHYFKMLEVPTALTETKKPPAILSMIGETPLIEITQFDTGPCSFF